jgi:hypothetical protein
VNSLVVTKMPRTGLSCTSAPLKSRISDRSTFVSGPWSYVLDHAFALGAGKPEVRVGVGCLQRYGQGAAVHGIGQRGLDLDVLAPVGHGVRRLPS